MYRAARWITLSGVPVAMMMLVENSCARREGRRYRFPDHLSWQPAEVKGPWPHVQEYQLQQAAGEPKAHGKGEGIVRFLCVPCL